MRVDELVIAVGGEGGAVEGSVVQIKGADSNERSERQVRLRSRERLVHRIVDVVQIDDEVGGGARSMTPIVIDDGKVETDSPGNGRRSEREASEHDTGLLGGKSRHLGRGLNRLFGLRTRREARRGSPGSVAAAEACAIVEILQNLRVLAGSPQLLQATADLLMGPEFASDIEYVLGDSLISLWEAFERL